MSIQTFFLPGPAGHIECLLKLSSSGQAAGAAVVCHPHPLFGGTMHNKVVHAMAATLVSMGIPTIRLNFRGAGLSEGTHDGGSGEQEDLRIVLDHLGRRFPGGPLLVAGYSFGAFVGLRVGCAESRVAGLLGVGVPVTLYDFSFLGTCGKPLVIIQGERDRFGPLPLLMGLSVAAGEGARLLRVHDAGHDFAHTLDQLRDRVREAVPLLLSRGAS